MAPDFKKTHVCMNTHVYMNKQVKYIDDHVRMTAAPTGESTVYAKT